MAKIDPVGPIVSASHLAEGFPALSELEFALTVANHAFQRWMARCMAASGLDGLSGFEVQLLHSVNHRQRAKSQAELCLMLNVEDTHLVSYAVRKLEKAGLVETGRRGKEKTVRASEAGATACERYRAVRDRLLVESLSTLDLDPTQVSSAATLLRALSGQYDQATRGAASL